MNSTLNIEDEAHKLPAVAGATTQESVDYEKSYSGVKEFNLSNDDEKQRVYIDSIELFY